MSLLFPHRLGAVVLAIGALGAAACSSGSGSLGLYGDAGTGDGGKAATVVDDPGPTAPTSGSCTHPASQALSQACCTERGADACGAGLFCAAFDGRTQATCYAEGSRADGQTCTADIQCSGNSCNASGICKKATPPPPPPTGKCPPTCKADTDCAATCPAIAGAVACCDTTVGICFSSKTPQCPLP
jgi:hypothetical protein